MRVVRCSTLPVLVRIADRDDILLAVPAGLSAEDVLSMAFLVLSTEEYTELRGKLGPAVSTVAGGLPVPRRPVVRRP
ncbi:hypothetical protein [Longispora albida]|uniref:hypothetical protein n=1 Tax=Longispora albida TaxID=203523 RepID=UPI00037EA54A|nr:hypothetical protein [Longispora albida]